MVAQPPLWMCPGRLEMTTGTTPTKNQPPPPPRAKTPARPGPTAAPVPPALGPGKSRVRPGFHTAQAHRTSDELRPRTRAWASCEGRSARSATGAAAEAAQGCRARPTAREAPRRKSSSPSPPSLRPRAHAHPPPAGREHPLGSGHAVGTGQGIRQVGQARIGPGSGSGMGTRSGHRQGGVFRPRRHI